MRIIFRILDLICILTALSLSSWFMLPPDLYVFEDYTGASTFTVIVFLLSFYMLDCYNVGREEFRDSAIRVLLAVIIGIVGTGFIFYSFEHWRFPRITFVVQMSINLALSLGWRAVYYWLSKSYVAVPENIIFLGSAHADRAKKILAEHSPEARVLGYVGGRVEGDSPAGSWLGSTEEVFAAIKQHDVSKLVVLEPQMLSQEQAASLFKAKLRGLKVEDMRGLYERLAARVPVDLISDTWLLLEDGFNLNVTRSLRRLKRAFDICFSLPLLVFATPVLVLTAVCVRLESKGPAIYSQKRVGLYGKEFTVYKIRSMRQDAESGGAVWASENDPRITRIGRFIRKTRIDELPQLINVLKGEMSVVGPRPERMEFVRELDAQIPFYNVRHTVKPGITGWAQVSYPYGASLEDSRIKLEYDLFYVKNLSILLECKILLKTIGVVLFPKGAR